MVCLRDPKDDRNLMMQVIKMDMKFSPAETTDSNPTLDFIVRLASPKAVEREGGGIVPSIHRMQPDRGGRTGLALLEKTYPLSYEGLEAARKDVLFAVSELYGLPKDIGIMEVGRAPHPSHMNFDRIYRVASILHRPTENEALYKVGDGVIRLIAGDIAKTEDRVIAIPVWGDYEKGNSFTKSPAIRDAILSYADYLQEGKFIRDLFASTLSREEVAEDYRSYPVDVREHYGNVDYFLLAACLDGKNKAEDSGTDGLEILRPYVPATTRNMLQKAEELGLESVSSPAILTGQPFGLPLSESVDMMLDSAVSHFASTAGVLRRFSLFLYGTDAYKTAESIADKKLERA